MSIRLEDVQGNILRGYRMPLARHFALQVGDPQGAASLLESLCSGSSHLSITSAAQWEQRPEYTLNLGVTYTGLQALGLSPGQLQQFPQAFREGPANPNRAPGLGDTGASAPSHWILGAPDGPAVHLLFSLHADQADHLESYTAQLREAATAAGLKEILSRDAVALPDGKVHFGYRDGIAQPQIKGAPGPRVADMQPDCDTGDFLLGCDYRNIYGGNYQGSLPSALIDNASFSAFRILEQDVRGFETFIELTGKRWNMDPEMVAAKLVGRWRNGTPLSLAPDSADVPIDPDQLNAFDYAPSDEYPHWFDDAQGTRCPMGSHIRRLNPRSSLVMGMKNSRRIVRRAMPYGPAYDPQAQDDTVERGLIGHFICGDLEMQFEFIQQVWVNEDISTYGIRGTREPLLGAQPAEGGKFTIRTKDTRDPVVIADLPRLITTRGSVYCLLPGLGGIRHLASVAAAAQPH